MGSLGREGSEASKELLWGILKAPWGRQVRGEGGHCLGSAYENS